MGISQNHPPKQDKLLLQLYHDGRINFFTQKIYKNRKCFNKTLNRFLNIEWVERKFIRLNGRYANEYILTAEGRMAIKFSFVKIYE